MSNYRKEKIYIIGSVASGKTTLAKRLSKLLDIPWYELDNVVHRRLPDGDVKRNPEEINSILNNIIDSKSWIIEGVYRDCFFNAFDKADKIILLDTPVYKRKWRIIKRWIKQNLKLEKANYKPTIKMLSLMFKWSKKFEKRKEKIIEMLKPYNEKVIIVGSNNLEIIKYL
ncbi:P-loop NTPase family protein [Natronospora cellulosivora (SeqCode)]